MKLAPRALLFVFLAAAAFALGAADSMHAQAQSTSISFTVQLTPSAGIAEPVRGLPFYLLRKSFASIQAEAEASVPKLDMDKFIDSQKVSKELNDWMHQHHSVTLTGQDFENGLTGEEILHVPEFWKAYDQLNTSAARFGFPTAKYNERLRERNPAKYQREVDDYHAKVLKYINEDPDSKQGMDTELSSMDPSHEWQDMVASRAARIRQMSLDWAQSRDLVAQTQSDLNGRGEFSNVPAGNYWLTSLNIEGQVGDAHAKWDVLVTVRAGAAAQIVLANYNAVPTKPIP